MAMKFAWLWKLLTWNIKGTSWSIPCYSNFWFCVLLWFFGGLESINPWCFRQKCLIYLYKHKNLYIYIYTKEKSSVRVKLIISWLLGNFHQRFVMELGNLGNIRILQFLSSLVCYFNLFDLFLTHKRSILFLCHFIKNIISISMSTKLLPWWYKFRLPINVMCCFGFSSLSTYTLTETRFFYQSKRKLVFELNQFLLVFAIDAPLFIFY